MSLNFDEQMIEDKVEAGAAAIGDLSISDPIASTPAFGYGGITPMQ